MLLMVVVKVRKQKPQIQQSTHILGLDLILKILSKQNFH